VRSSHTVDVGLRTEATITFELLRRGMAALRRSYEGDADVFLVHCPDTEAIYAVPVADAPRRSVTLRVDPTANSQAKGIRWASDYVLPA
jgi:hypothetical protein